MSSAGRSGSATPDHPRALAWLVDPLAAPGRDRRPRRAGGRRRHHRRGRDRRQRTGRHALRHAKPLHDNTVRIHWTERNGIVEVEVSDGGGDTAPRAMPQAVFATSGRGLRIVRSLAHEWGVTERAAERSRCGPPSVVPPGVGHDRLSWVRHHDASTPTPPGTEARGIRPEAVRRDAGRDGLGRDDGDPARGDVTVPLAAGVSGTDGPGSVTVATVLPMAWPAIRRADGSILIATQGGPASGDASRDLASALLAALAVAPERPRACPPARDRRDRAIGGVGGHLGAPEVTGSRRLRLLGRDRTSTLRRGESLARANGSVVPTTKMRSAPSAYWCLLNGRAHLRLVLPDDEDASTDALARLYAAGEAGLGDGTRLLGAFRTCGLLVPVWELAGDSPADDYEDALAAFAERYAAALRDTPLAGGAARPQRPPQPPGHPPLTTPARREVK